MQPVVDATVERVIYEPLSIPLAKCHVASREEE